MSQASIAPELVPNPFHGTSKYKQYAQAVDKALKAFENTNEWADLISALQKLSKVFSSNSKFGDIPKPVIVAKRLSQCLHPALPMGVHLKALETYRQVFDILGTEKLAQLLYLFAVGLFPLMDHCGIKVKSELFSIFEIYLLKLGGNLRPSLPGFLAGVLLGLEEGTEFYDRSVVFLDKVCDAVGPDTFYGCIWEAVLGSPPVRLPALIYVNTKLDKNKTMCEQKHLLSTPELMIEALCAAADDNGSPLVQRHLLDFLCTAFPFDSPLLPSEHFVKLLQHCLFIVLRRDMSLNRRLYQWLLNPTGSTLAVSGVAVGDDRLDASFFLKDVLPLLQKALTNYLELDTVEMQAPATNSAHFGYSIREGDQSLCEVRVCRLLLYLQDRPEIGKPVLSNILPIFLIDLVKRNPENEQAESESFDDSTFSGVKKFEPTPAELYAKRLDSISKAFNLLLSSLDDGFIWEHLASWFTRLLRLQSTDDEQNEDERNIHAQQLHHFPWVVRQCISLCQLDSSFGVRLLHLPRFLHSILRDLAVIDVTKIPMDVYLELISVCQKLLEEMTVGVGPISVFECEDSTPNSSVGSPVKKILGDSRRDKEQKLLEECLLDCLCLFEVISGQYLIARDIRQLPLFIATCKLVSRFVDFPLYCLDLETPIQSQWIETLIKVVDVCRWTELGANCDFTARAACVDLLCYIYVRSSQVLEQHKEIQGAKEQPMFSSTTTVLLKPMLLEKELRTLETQGIFEKSAKALWKTISSNKHASLHASAAHLLAIIHARRPQDPSSEAEGIMLAELTQQDQVSCAIAVRTFDRVWTLTRGNEDLLPGLPPKLFSRVVMFLLGILSDESVGSEKITLKSTAINWFVGCAKHNDLPRIVQMLSTMLMNPVTARVSIQYVTVQEKITGNDVPSMPTGTQAISLFTSDERHKMHHVIFEDQSSPSTASSSWLPDLRSRLLTTFEDVDTTIDRSADFLNRTRRPTQDHDIPNFDDDTDSISLDTLSMSINQEGIEPAVYDCLQYMIDIVVENEESEMDIERRFREAHESGKLHTENVVFRAGVDSDDKAHVQIEEQPPLPNKDCVSRIKRGHRRTDSLQESIFNCGTELKLLEQCEIARPNQKLLSADDETDGISLFDELHTHMLLYGESGRLVDLSRCESAFRILTALLRPRGGPALPPRMLLNCLVSSGTSTQDASTSNNSGSLVELMSRHVKAILGQQFWSTGGEDDGKQAVNRHFTLLELLLTITLHFLRSYFLNSPIAVVNDDDLVKSWKCKMAALDFLTSLLVELGEMLRAQQSQALVAFIQTILQRSKLQKCLLHLLLTAVHDPRGTDSSSVPVSVTIAEFNEGRWATPEKRQHILGLLSAYNSSLLALTAATIRLEHDIKIGYREFNELTASGFVVNRLPLTPTLTMASQHRSTIRDSQPPLVELKMFLVTVLSAIKHKPERHEIWFQFVIYILPWIDRSLATFCTHVIEQLCKNIENAAINAFPEMEKTIAERTPSENPLSDQFSYPANYLISCLETLTTVIHFCVVGGTSNLSSTIQDETKSNRNSGGMQSSSSGMVGQAMQAIPGTQLLTNLVKAAFTFNDTSTATGVPLAKLDPKNASWQEARRQILTGLPHSLATLCDVWGVVRQGATPIYPVGQAQHLRRLIIDLLSPIAQNHQSHYLQAMSLVWLTRAKLGIQSKTENDVASFTYSRAQMDVADLLLSIRMLSFETVLAGVAESLRDQSGKAGKPTTLLSEKNSFPTEAPLLELVHGCLRSLTFEQVTSCWSSLHSLFIDSSHSTLPPRAVFLQFIMLCDFVRIVGPLYIIEDRATVRAVHDSCQKLTEAINGIVGWQLEATTWLKRTLVVKSDPTTVGKISHSVDASPMQETPSNGPVDLSSVRGSTTSLMQNRPASLETNSLTSSTSTQYTTALSIQDNKKSSASLRSSLKQVQDSNNNKRDPAHSTQALFLLAEHLPELIDSICKSDDKERLLPTLHAVWANVVPYLKSKNARYARFFLAASQLLANMSSYNYMRSVWKKTTLELLLDSSFFRMDVHSIRQWLIVTDHLMTLDNASKASEKSTLMLAHDKTSFKELLKSISYTSSSLNLMQSREQEYEARTQALKRLAFIVFSSEVDQYHTQLPDIQERLAENLRVCPHPPIRAAVLLCYRVLLIRLRPHSLVSMWPAMVTELIHVLLQVEQQLSDDPADGNKEEYGARDDQWMQLFLASSKLLEALCTLPAGYVAQFQMCNWAFVTSVATGENPAVFTPFANRISKRLQTKYGQFTEIELDSTPATLSGMKLLTSFDELRPFFYALTMHGRTIGQKNQKAGSPFWRDANILSGRLGYSAAISRLEQALYVDFAEHWQL
ncbi:unnamed protein product, partial [Mesorhabditis belari]|uniref:Dopey N-terminal domain-containing protein n=1 Tax=Mesorhabditis belari TaxID=2138241 RepID=A0AAF3ECN8_9BILA